jgi:hypothetical protein
MCTTIKTPSGISDAPGMCGGGWEKHQLTCAGFICCCIFDIAAVAVPMD